MDGDGGWRTESCPQWMPVQAACSPASPAMIVVDVDHPSRLAVEAFIARRYHAAYGARVQAFLPTLFALVDTEGALLAAAGMRRASAGPLFIEQYLDAPLESVLAARYAAMPCRGEIAEIGHLSGLGAGNGRRLFPLIAVWMEETGIGWGAFAATAPLRALFARIGVQPLLLGKAERSRLGSAAAAWGSYYETDPWVVGGPLELGRSLLRGRS
jgi:hypothetical protein